MVTISISGYGIFQIPSEKLQELLNWLSVNNGVRTQNNENFQNKTTFNVKDLING